MVTLMTVQQRIFQAVDIAYQNGDGRLSEQLEAGERGDTLADFIVNEISSVTSNITDERTALVESIKAIQIAKQDIQSVEFKLIEMLIALPDPA